MPVTERKKKEDNYVPEPQWDAVFGTIEKNDMNAPDWEEQGDRFIPIAYCITMEVADQHGEVYVIRRWVAPPTTDEDDETNQDEPTEEWWDFVLTDVYCSLRELFA